MPTSATSGWPDNAASVVLLAFNPRPPKDLLAAARHFVGARCAAEVNWSQIPINCLLVRRNGLTVIPASPERPLRVALITIKTWLQRLLALRMQLYFDILT